MRACWGPPLGCWPSKRPSGAEDEREHRALLRGSACPAGFIPTWTALLGLGGGRSQGAGTSKSGAWLDDRATLWGVNILGLSASFPQSHLCARSLAGRFESQTGPAAWSRCSGLAPSRPLSSRLVSGPSLFLGGCVRYIFRTILAVNAVLEAAFG